MALISKKKIVYRVSPALRNYLDDHARLVHLPVSYDDLTRYHESAPVYDKNGKDTLWATCCFSPSERDEVFRGMVETYAALKVRGDMSVVEHLVTDRVDVCTWGNTLPFRARILNTLNENFDYFYIKKADASRVYGLELEHLLSPNSVEFLYDRNTLVEEHIAGIPGQLFIERYLDAEGLDRVRVAKEFVKFNERCLCRLLGDMHPANFVISMMPDLDQTMYRIRAIDFDQQSYEPRAHVYLPQYYVDNNPIIFMGMDTMNAKSVHQYRLEERSLMRNRARASASRLTALLETMAGDELSPKSHVLQLRRELSRYHGDQRFLSCRSMGDIVTASLSMLDWN